MKPSKLIKMLAREAANQAIEQALTPTEVYTYLNQNVINDSVRNYAIFIINGFSFPPQKHEFAGGELFAYCILTQDERRFKDDIREHLENLYHIRYESPFASLWPMFKKRFAALDDCIW